MKRYLAGLATGYTVGIVTLAVTYFHEARRTGEGAPEIRELPTVIGMFLVWPYAAYETMKDVDA